MDLDHDSTPYLGLDLFPDLARHLAFDLSEDSDLSPDFISKLPLDSSPDTVVNLVLDLDQDRDLVCR